MGDISAVLAQGSLYRVAAEVFPAIGKLITKVSGLNEKFEGYNRNWNQFMAEILEEHKKKMVNTEEEDFVDVLLRARNDGTAGFDLTENGIIAIVRVGLLIYSSSYLYMSQAWVMVLMDSI